MSQQRKITIAQSINIAKDIAIAQKGAKVTVEDVANLAPSVYEKLFKETATKIYLDAENKETLLSFDDLVKGLEACSDPVQIRNDNLESLRALNEKEKGLIKEKFIKFNIK